MMKTLPSFNLWKINFLKNNNIEAKLLHLNNAVKETHITDRLQESTSTEGNIHTNHMEKAEILFQILVSIQALLYQL